MHPSIRARVSISSSASENISLLSSFDSVAITFNPALSVAGIEQGIYRIYTSIFGCDCTYWKRYRILSAAQNDMLTKVMFFHITSGCNARSDGACFSSGRDLRPADRNLAVGPRKIGVDGAWAEVQPAGYLAVGQPLGDHTEHLDFAMGKPIGIVGRWRRAHDWL